MEQITLNGEIYIKKDSISLEKIKNDNLANILKEYEDYELLSVLKPIIEDKLNDNYTDIHSLMDEPDSTNTKLLKIYFALCD